MLFTGATSKLMKTRIYRNSAFRALYYILMVGEAVGYVRVKVSDRQLNISLEEYRGSFQKPG